MTTLRYARFRRWAPILGAAALLALTCATAFGAERIVHVGQGGEMAFNDGVSGTKISTIQKGDTVTWVWEGTMNHTVTSGTCRDDGGGGGYYGGGGGSSCTDDHAWTSSGPRTAGFTMSHTFPDEGSFPYYCEVHGTAMTGKVVVEAATASGPCEQEPERLCLGDGRFAVKTEWQKSDGTSGHGTGVKLTGDSGYFYFFDQANIEVVVKVLDGCAITNAYWVFGAGLTNVAVHLEVTDTLTGAVYTRDNSQGSAFEPIQDTAAFPTSCP